MAGLYLIPIPIADDALHTLSEEIGTVTLQVQHYFVENVRTARRFLKALHPSIVIDNLHFSEIDKHNGPDLRTLAEWLKNGYSIGVMSEAGCPGIADPGSVLVQKAHELNVDIIPLTGPNSMILALMASGLNGQSFAFHGYLPLKDPARSKRIKELEQLSAKEKQTQIFIETPYRNQVLFEELLKNCNNSTWLCIARNVTGANAYIKTRSIADWKKNKPDWEKQPTVFLVLA
ncbi:MAG: SAM-dependent methyltransferase [Chitinophagales bacterium]|nr:SAM-dependent methyltransferase [Chitinophagales bacterium]